MMELRACSGCGRHVAIAETVCPFCASTLEPATPPAPPRGRLSRAALFAGATLAGTACWSGQASSSVANPSETAASGGTGAENAVPTDTKKPPVTTATLEGFVTNSRTKQPLPSFPVVATAGATTQQTSTDANGRYTLAKLPPGDYVVTFGYNNHPRRRPAQVPVKLTAGEKKRLDQAVYVPEPSNIPMPYGAPPARARIV